MAHFMTAQEIADAGKRLSLPCIPHSKRGVNKRADKEGWDEAPCLARKRFGAAGGGGMEYDVSLLPEPMQVALEAESANAVTVLNTKEARAIDTIKREALDTTALTARQRTVMNARSMVLSAIESVQIDGGHTRSQTVDLFISGAIDFGLDAETVAAANDRKGGSRVISRSTLLRWFRFRDGTGVGALAPKATKERADIPAWFWDFLKHYARPQKPCITEAMNAYLNSNQRPNETVTYTKVRRLISKLGNVEKHRGREGSLTLKSRQAYVTRSTGDLLPTCVYTSDGKTFDAEIQHPLHGRPFRPEITAVVDVATRKCVGFSVGLAENAEGVVDALRHSCEAFGVPAIFYVDRGSGFKNKRLDAQLTGLMGRLGISHDFPAACGAGRVWREGEIVTKNDVRIEGLGAMQKVRGRRHGPFRPGLVFLDDLENDDSVRSPEQRKKLEGWVDKAVSEVGPPDGSLKVIYVGTILHFDAVLARKAKAAAWNTTQFQAIMMMPDRMDLWEQYEEEFHNFGPDAATAFYKKNKKAMDKGAVVCWPSMQPLEFLMAKRANNHASFATEYQNKPISEGNPFGDITYWVQRLPKLLHFGAIDPSLGKKAKGRDPSAILVGGINPDNGVMDLLEASIRKRLPDIIISETIQMQRDYGCHLWFVEAVQFQEFLRTTLMKDAAKAHVPLPAMPVTPHADKDLRIERLQPPMKGGLIRLNTTQTTLIDQLQQWPNADHDDGPDCLDMLWQNAIIYSAGATGGGEIATTGTLPSISTTEGYRIR